VNILGIRGSQNRLALLSIRRGFTPYRRSTRCQHPENLRAPPCLRRFPNKMHGMLLTPFLAALAPETSEVEHWFNYPLIRLGEDTITVLTIAKVLFWIAAVLILNLVLQRVVLRRMLKFTRLNEGLQFAIAKMAGYTAVIVGIYVALVANGVNLSSLALVAGAIGLGIGFGLQNLVANFVSGIVILAERPIAIGDRVEVEGVAGRVTQMNIRATTIRTNDNIAIIVPNSQFTANPVTNLSHGDKRLRLRLPIGVAYGTDVERLRTVLTDAARTHPDVLAQPEPVLYFDGFGDNSLNFELAVWTDTMTHSPRRFRSELNFIIERTLREARIQIPFPQRVVHLAPPPREPDETA
jgi:small-conductance mechanosensitive channel